MMIQKRIIEKFNKIFKNINSIQSTIIIGSFGREMPKPNSDIDYQILVNESFDNHLFFNSIKSEFDNELKHSLFLENKNKWCFYLTENYIATEIFICSNLNELNKYYLGSEISDPENAVVFDKTKTVIPYLKKIQKEKQNNFSQIQKNKVQYLIIEFQNRFEACSSAHAKSDGYKFNILFSHGLNAVVRLIYLCNGATEYDYMPPNFLTDYSYKLNLGIEKLGTLDLRQANWNKRKLLDLFFEYLDIAIEKFEIDINKDEITDFLENIYKRDFFWNFRDISKFNSKIKKGIIYRSSAFCLVNEEERLIKMLEKHNIKTIIDLRADREIAENSYSERIKSKFNIIHAPFDPWDQSIEFRNTYNTGTNIEIAYQFFSLECKPSIKKVVESVLNTKDAISIHCYAGKDRTGIVITLFHLLTGANEETIFFDYLASEMDTKKEHLQILLDIIEDAGGITAYLKSCGLSEYQINELRLKLCR